MQSICLALVGEGGKDTGFKSSEKKVCCFVVCFTEFPTQVTGRAWGDSSRGKAFGKALGRARGVARALGLRPGNADFLSFLPAFQHLLSPWPSPPAATLSTCYPSLNAPPFIPRGRLLPSLFPRVLCFSFKGRSHNLIHTMMHKSVGLFVV